MFIRHIPKLHHCHSNNFLPFSLGPVSVALKPRSCLVSMPHSYCMPECVKKGYKTVTIDGRKVKVSFHNFPDETKRDLQCQWVHAIRHDIGKALLECN